MPQTEDEKNEQMNPDEGGPFRLGKLIGTNKREVTPDATKLTIVNIEDTAGYGARFRDWFLRNNGPATLLIMLVVIISYVVPSEYFPQATELVFGMVLMAIVLALISAYEYERRQDRHHNIFVDQIRIKLKETVVAREKTKEGGVETKVIVPKITERRIYLAKDYMFEGKKGDPYRIEKYNCQIVGEFGKIIDVSYVDETGRILIGEGEGDLPSGLIVKIAYPSRTELSEEVKKAEKLRKEGGIPEKEFLEFKGAVDQYNLWRDQVIEKATKHGISMIDIDAMNRKQRSFFVALAKDSVSYWRGEAQDPVSLQEYKQMDPSILMPKLLNIIRDQNDYRADKLDYMINRESDKIEAEIGATFNIARMDGRSKEAVEQFLVEQRKALVSVQSKTEKEMEEEVNGRREDTE